MRQSLDGRSWQGQVAYLPTFPTNGQKSTQIAPLVFATLVDRTSGVELFRVVQTASNNLRVRLQLLLALGSRLFRMRIFKKIRDSSSKEEMIRCSGIITI